MTKEEIPNLSKLTYLPRIIGPFVDILWVVSTKLVCTECCWYPSNVDLTPVTFHNWVEAKRTRAKVDFFRICMRRRLPVRNDLCIGSIDAETFSINPELPTAWWNFISMLC